MYQMGPAGIDVVEEAEDPNDEATSEIPARPRTPPMMSKTRKAFRNVGPPLPTRRPARRARHARRPFSPTVATPQNVMGSQNLNALCDRPSLTELRTGMHGRVLDGHEPEEFGRAEDRAQPVQFHVDFLRNRGDVGDAPDLIDRLHKAQDLAHGHLRDRMKVGHAAAPSNAFAAIRHLTSSLQTMRE